MLKIKDLRFGWVCLMNGMVDYHQVLVGKQAVRLRRNTSFSNKQNMKLARWKGKPSQQYMV